MAHSSRFLTFALVACVALAPALSAAEVTGTVSNAATRSALEGAVVELPALARQVLTDRGGRFVFSAVPPGDYVVTASYLGLDAGRSALRVTEGARAQVDFSLTTSIYQLKEFVVTGEREGSAAAITQQRNAPNAKNVVAMDSFGNLPNLSAGELAIRLPGVAGNLDDEGNVTGVTVRGMGPTLNRVTVDGDLISNVGGMNRQFQMHSLTGAMFEGLEVIKGHTPDRSADSLGGTINLKTRSPLTLREKRRIDYNFGARWAPPFTEQIPLRRDHPIHPLLNVAYQEVFGVFGGDRNLGVAVNAFYSENVSGRFRSLRDYQNTTNQPAYVWDYRTFDGYNNRKQKSLNLKFDYQLSAATRLSFNAIVNDAFEPFGRNWEVRAFTSQNIAVLGANGQPAGTNAILPGFTDRFTQVRGVPASTVTITQAGGNFLNRTRSLNLGGETDLERWHVDYSAAYSQTHINIGNAGFAGLTLTATGIGWILDRTDSDLYPRFIQTEGPSIANLSSYRVGPLTTSDNARNVEVANVQGAARYDLPTTWPLALKSGAGFRRQKVGEVNGNRRWSYISSLPLPVPPSVASWDAEKTGRVVPLLDTAPLMDGKEVRDSSLWREDLYFREQSRYTGTRGVIEAVTSAYLMGTARVGPVGLLTGVRFEATEAESFGWVRARLGSTAAQQAADPIGAATRDYAGTARRLEGRYDDFFPSAHLTYNLRRDLKARLSWSTSFGRPAFTNLLPNETVNETQQTLTINNASLKPQYSKNWDAALEYYFEPVGMLSAGFFHKTVTDFIVTGINAGVVPLGNDNGYGGDYAGYTLLTSANAGTAFVQGWELAYQQQFSFLPGVFRGLGVTANYTFLRTHGDFGTARSLSGSQVAGFIPKTANLNLTYKYRAFSANFLLNHTSRYLQTDSTSPGRVIFRFPYTTVNAGISWRLRSEASLFCNVANLLNEPQRTYRYVPSQMERTMINGTTLTFGVTGRF